MANRTKKIRGYKRRIKAIEQWRNDHLYLHIDWLVERQLAYVKFKVYPWTISIVNSSIPQPKGKIRLRIINGLLDIYDQWQLQLAILSQPYYLKIWLYEPRLLESQVVCALGGRIDYYKSLFSDLNGSRQLQMPNYSQSVDRIASYSWKQYRDVEIYVDNGKGNLSDYQTSSDYYESINWIQRQLKKVHEVKALEDGRKLYFIKKGSLWVGGQDTKD